jgi:hypothetical protein
LFAGADGKRAGQKIVCADYRLPFILEASILRAGEHRHAHRREEVATMINDMFEVGVAGAVLTAGTSHAAHAATPAAALKHRAAATTDASVDWGLT